MKRTTMILAALLLAGQADVAFAKLDRVAMKVITNTFGSGSGSSTTTCETSSWGDSDEGGTETVCAGSDGSSSWSTSEWADGALYEDSGSVTMQGSGTFSSQSSSSDTSSSGGPRKPGMRRTLAR